VLAHSIRVFNIGGFGEFGEQWTLHSFIISRWLAKLQYGILLLCKEKIWLYDRLLLPNMQLAESFNSDKIIRIWNKNERVRDFTSRILSVVGLARHIDPFYTHVKEMFCCKCSVWSN